MSQVDDTLGRNEGEISFLFYAFSKETLKSQIWKLLKRLISWIVVLPQVCFIVKFQEFSNYGLLTEKLVSLRKYFPERLATEVNKPFIAMQK